MATKRVKSDGEYTKSLFAGKSEKRYGFKCGGIGFTRDGLCSLRFSDGIREPFICRFDAGRLYAWLGNCRRCDGGCRNELGIIDARFGPINSIGACEYRLQALCSRRAGRGVQSAASESACVICRRFCSDFCLECSKRYGGAIKRCARALSGSYFCLRDGHPIALDVATTRFSRQIRSI